MAKVHFVIIRQFLTIFLSYSRACFLGAALFAEACNVRITQKFVKKTIEIKY